jgi:asparagine synthase (glutamine-hydrolysing)
LRDAVRDVVPDTVLSRTDKRGLPTPLAAWMRGPLRDFAREVLTDPILRRNGLVDPVHVQHLFDAQAAGIRDFSFQLWRPLVTAIWLAKPQAPSDEAGFLALAG